MRVHRRRNGCCQPRDEDEDLVAHSWPGALAQRCGVRPYRWPGGDWPAMQQRSRMPWADKLRGRLGSRGLRLHSGRDGRGHRWQQDAHVPGDPTGGERRHGVRLRRWRPLRRARRDACHLRRRGMRRANPVRGGLGSRPLSVHSGSNRLAHRRHPDRDLPHHRTAHEQRRSVPTCRSGAAGQSATDVRHGE